MKNKNWEKDPEFFDIDPESIDRYREFMTGNFDLILRNKSYFLQEKEFSTSFKIDRIEELLDFFLIEEDFEKCSELQSIKELLEIKLIIDHE